MTHSPSSSSRGGGTIKTGHPRGIKPNVEIKVEEEPSSPVQRVSIRRSRGGRELKAYYSVRSRVSSPTQMGGRDRGGADDVGSKEKEEGKVVKTKEKEKSVKEKKSSGVGIQQSGSTSSSALANAASNGDQDGEQEKITTTTATTTNISISDLPHHTPLSLDLTHTKPLEFELVANMLDPKRLSEDSAIAATGSSSPSLPSLTPSTPGPLVSGDADAEVRERYRELKARFLVLKDALGGIIGKLEGLEGGAGWDEDGDLGRAGRPDYVSQGCQTEENRERKGKEKEKIYEMMGYADAAVGLDGLVAFKDVSVQTHKPSHSAVASSTAIAVQTVNVVGSLPAEMDDLSNARNLKSTHLEPKNDDILHPFTTTDSLSTIVDNLVSVKMLSMMQMLVKSNVGAHNNKLKPVVENTTSNNECDSDILRQPSPSTQSSLSISASHSMETCDNMVTSLLDELKTIKEEARCREQNEKEDLLAMRQLHSAEVDALRRRLSYLESSNLSFGRWESDDAATAGSGSGSRRWRGSASMRIDSLDLDRRHHHHYRHHRQFLEDHPTSFRQQYVDHSNGLDRHSSSSSTVHPDSESARTTNNNATTTPQSSYTPLSFKKVNPSLQAATTTILTTDSAKTNPISSLATPLTPSERHHPYGFSRNNSGTMDLDDDLPLPLPVKSQRKHHMMALARAHFS